MFVDRISELQLLEKRFASNQAELFVLYGRRRVGKTELLAHFCQDKRNIFFVSDLGSEASLRANLSSTMNAVLFGQEINAVYPTWEDIFLTLARSAENERLIVVLDEFPYLVAAYPPLSSVLQRVWDQTLKNSQIMLILCGSYIGMMEQTILGYRAPLYGRRTGQYLLEPLDFYSARLFYPKYSAEEQVRTYAVYGGTPAYLQTIQPDQSLASNILEGILERGSYLYDEVRFVLQQELREPRNYFAILQAIAGGVTRLNEIKQATGIDGATAYLETLQQLHLVERATPVTEQQPQKSRRGLYRLTDHYLRFWFRYVLPNRSQLERGGGKIIQDNQILPQLDTFTGPVFEDICRQFLWRTGLAGGLPFTPSNLDRWWKANEEIDLIAIGQEQALLVECKWSNRAVGIDILSKLERKAHLATPDLGGRRPLFGLCSRSGFTPQLEQLQQSRNDLLLFDLPAIINDHPGGNL